MDGAISEKEKNAISDGTLNGTVNEIVITQKRVIEASEEIKQQIVDEVRRSEEYASGRLVEFFDITMWKTTTIRNANGDQYITQENITVAETYQTNIFPISTALKQEIVAVGGTVENIFVYKRHVYDGGVMVIYNLPKYTEAEGEKANTECFFIKHVAGEAYIAIRQKEYSVLAFGVSPEPILVANEITELLLPDRTYGDPAGIPVVHARYGENNAIITYSTEYDGDYSAVVPTAAGTYYVKAYIPATGEYAGAQKIETFTIRKKVIARPEADPTRFVYSGAAQTYTIAPSTEYAVSGNVQVDAGRHVVTVTLTDAANTVWDSGLGEPLSFDFVIEKKKLTDIGTITFEDKQFWFNGKKHSIAISGELPEGVTVVYQNNDESDLGKYIVTATFVSENSNYDVSDPMTAVMLIRLNWIPIVILIIIALLIIVAAIVIVEKMMKKEKQGDNPPNGGDGGGTPQASDEGENTVEEGSNND